MEVLGDKDDSRCLHITVKTSPTNQRSSQSKVPILQAKFLFDDHIRCMAAKQRYVICNLITICKKYKWSFTFTMPLHHDCRLVKGKHKARQRKLHIIARMLDLNGSYPPSPPPQRRLVNSKIFKCYTSDGLNSAPFQLRTCVGRPLARSDRPIFTPTGRHEIGRASWRERV